MIAPVPQGDTAAEETRSLLARSNGPNTKPSSVINRIRKAPLTVAFVVATALFTDMVVYGVVVPLLPIIVKGRLGGTSSDVGLLFASYAIGLLASTPIFAILSDKYQNRRIPMMVGMLGLAVATVGFSLASNYWVLIVARIGQGSAGGASWTIGLGMLADVYPPNNLGTVMGATMMANTMGFLLGPVVGAYFYEYHGYKAPFIFCAVLATLDFLCILFIAEPEKRNNVIAVSPSNSYNGDIEAHAQDVIDDIPNQHQKHKQAGSSSSSSSSTGDDSQYGSVPGSSSSSTNSSAVKSKDDSNKSWTDVSMYTIASNWTITCCLLATFVGGCVFTGLEPILPLYLGDMLHATPTQTGLILMAAVFPSFLSSVIGYYADRVGHFYVSFVGMVIFAIAALSLALPKSFTAFILPLALFGLGSSMVQTPLLPAMADVVVKEGWNGFAKTYALYNMVYSLSMAVGPTIAGFIYQDYSFPLTMVMFGTMTILAIPVVYSAQIKVFINYFMNVFTR